MSYNVSARATDNRMRAASYIGRQFHIVGEFAIRPVNRSLHNALYESERTKSPYIAIFDHGGVMKKSLIIFTLTLLQCACATQEPVPITSNALISFSEFSAEITVGYEKAEAVDDLSQTVAINREK